MTIEAKIIADSINPQGVRITTFEIESPRIVHSELLTHRMLARNSASSRAIPIATMLATIRNNPAMPFKWGKNQPGMQAKEDLSYLEELQAKNLWVEAMTIACEISEEMASVGVHKQIANRITEPYQHMKVVLTATDFANWYWLRDHPDADPTIAELARVMRKAHENSVPVPLKDGMWHMPYVEQAVNGNFGTQVFFDDQKNMITTDEALMISASCCAQVSYRKSDGSLEKAETIYKRLVESEPCHASPVEHQACVRVQFLDDLAQDWAEGITHIKRNGDWYSGNFRKWIQHRQLIENESVYG